MNYSIYSIAYYIIGFVICISYLMYKTLTAKADDDFDETGFLAIMMFILWPIIIPTTIFVWIQNKLKK